MQYIYIIDRLDDIDIATSVVGVLEKIEKWSDGKYKFRQYASQTRNIKKILYRGEKVNLAIGQGAPVIRIWRVKINKEN